MTEMLRSERRKKIRDRKGISRDGKDRKRRAPNESEQQADNWFKPCHDQLHPTTAFTWESLERQLTIVILINN